MPEQTWWLDVFPRQEGPQQELRCVHNPPSKMSLSLCCLLAALAINISINMMPVTADEVLISYQQQEMAAMRQRLDQQVGARPHQPASPPQGVHRQMQDLHAVFMSKCRSTCTVQLAACSVVCWRMCLISTMVWHLHLQDGEIQQLLAARAQEAGAEGQLHERLNFVAFKHQLLVDMVGRHCPPASLPA
jgi:hypothetical protein